MDTQAGMLRLLPAETHDVEDGPNPDTWEYRITLGWPSRTFTYDFVPASSVLHFRYAVDPTKALAGQRAYSGGGAGGYSERRNGEAASGRSKRASG